MTTSTKPDLNQVTAARRTVIDPALSEHPLTSLSDLNRRVRTRLLGGVGAGEGDLPGYPIRPHSSDWWAILRFHLPYFTDNCRVDLGGYPPRSPTDPDVRNYRIRFFRYTALLPSLSAVVSVRCSRASVCPPSFPPAVPCPDTPFPPRGPLGRFPRLYGTMRCCDSLPSLF